MMRADLFALYSLCSNKEFVKVASDTIAIKKSIIKFLHDEMNHRASELRTFEKLEGWN